MKLPELTLYVPLFLGINKYSTLLKPINPLFWSFILSVNLGSYASRLLGMSNTGKSSILKLPVPDTRKDNVADSLVWIESRSSLVVNWNSPTPPLKLLGFPSDGKGLTFSVLLPEEQMFVLQWVGAIAILTAGLIEIVFGYNKNNVW